VPCLRRWRRGGGGRRRRTAFGGDPAARRGGAAAQSQGRAKGARRCPKGGGRALWECFVRFCAGSRDTSIAGDSSFLAKRGRGRRLEVSTDQIDDHTRAETCPYERRARACARSCSLGRTRHLCKLLLSLGRLRAARRALGPDPSPTPPARTTLVVRAARWALTRRRRQREPHTHKTKPHPRPATKPLTHPNCRRRPINAGQDGEGRGFR
jgi:hypothetical protein